MKEIKKRLDNVNVIEIDDYSAEAAIRQLLEINRLLVAKIEQIPDWVWKHKCCPPGEECCSCD